MSSVLRDKTWYWQPARSEDLVKVQSQLPMVSIGENDQPTWSISTRGIYNCVETWEHIRYKLPQVTWWRLIWFSLAIPRQAFFLWLAARDSLTKGERLLRWGYGGNVLCGFCRRCIEGRSHLFFQCNFSKRVWLANLSKCLIDDPPIDWEDIIDRGVKEWTGKELQADFVRFL
jgi:hypothetical protein